MQVSVVIATYDRRRLLEKTLPALLSQQFPSADYEVIVVVDGSTDGTLEFLRTQTSTNLHIIEQRNQGQAAAINAGVRAARGDILLFLDDDIVCGPTLVAEHARAPRHGQTCLAFGPVLVASEGRDSLVLDWARTFCDDFFTKEVKQSPDLGWYGCLASANSSVPRSVIQSIGFLDESFTRKNDIELGHRALDAGYRFVYIPEAVTHQIYVKTQRDVIADAGEDGAAEIRLCRKFPKVRVQSRFALIQAKPWPLRLGIRLIASFPFSVSPLLNPFVWASGCLRSVPFFRRIALRLLMALQNIAAYRSAVQEAGSWNALHREFGVRLPILMYHSVGPLREGFDAFLNIPPEMFENHLRWLARKGYTTIHLADWIAWCRDGKPLPEKPVVLTFDDGYRDTAEFGFPLLKKYGFKGTLFLVTDQIGATNVWDLPLGVSEQPLMTREEVRFWAVNGIEIGSHSRSHPDLRSCDSGTIAMELKQSREQLEELLGKPVTSFAYPYGYLDDRAPEAARKVYDAAVTCDIGTNLLSTDPMQLNRAIVIPRFTWGQMFWSVTFGYNLFLMLRIQAGLRLGPLLRRVLPRREH